MATPEVYVHKIKGGGEVHLPEFTSKIGIIRAFSALNSDKADDEKSQQSQIFALMDVIFKYILNGEKGEDALNDASLEEFNALIEGWSQHGQKVAEKKAQSAKA